MTHEFNLSQRIEGFVARKRRRTDPPTAYSRIIVPMKVTETDCAAISMAIALASGREAEITLLNFIPESLERMTKLQSPSIGNCLDAISLIHDVRFPSSSPVAYRNPSERLEESRALVKKFIEDRFPSALSGSAKIQINCQFGQFERDIVPFCHAMKADLVILSSRMLSWWKLLMVGHGVRKVLNRARIPVAIVRPLT